MRILTVVENLGLGGTERVAQNFSVGYKNSNCETKVLATKAMGVRAAYLESENIEVFDGQKDFVSSIQKINTWKPDIIHIHRPGYYNEMNSLLSLIKLADTKVMETNVFARPDYSKSANLVDIHLHLSNWCLWKWQNWTKNLNQLGAIVPYLVDCEKINPIEQTNKHHTLNNLPKEAIILGRIGQPIPAKWNGMIFDVLQELLQKNGQYYLALVGLPDVLKTKLKTYPKLVQDHTILIDPIHNDIELNTLYKSFDIFLHASQIGESFGMVLAEAHLNKLPIITLSTPLKDNTQNELIGNGRGGFVVADHNNMVKAIELLASDKGLREKLGSTGAEYIKANYEMGLITNKALTVCDILSKNLCREQTLVALKSNHIITHCDDRVIHELNKNMMGELSFKDNLMLKLIHNPLFYRNYLRLKGIKEDA